MIRNLLLTAVLAAGSLAAPAPAEAKLHLTMDQLVEACQSAGLTADQCGDYAADRTAQGTLVITDLDNYAPTAPQPTAPAPVRPGVGPTPHMDQVIAQGCAKTSYTQAQYDQCIRQGQAGLQLHPGMAGFQEGMWGALEAEMPGITQIMGLSR